MFCNVKKKNLRLKYTKKIFNIDFQFNIDSFIKISITCKIYDMNYANVFAHYNNYYDQQLQITWQS